MTPQQYRQRKDELIRREFAARARAQNAAVAVDDAKASGNEQTLDDAMQVYRAAVAELEELMHETGEFDG